ncbi:MAG: transglutaminase domain-containing protein [Deltaproteobacteria bacterium]
MLLNNLNQFSSYTNTFTFYKRISEQYNNQSILDSVKQLVPENILKSSPNDQLKPLLNWFKNDFIKWMPKELYCKICDNNRSMNVQIIEGDSTILRKTEIHTCDNCGSKQMFPRYAKILKIAETKIGRCSEWSILFGAILNSLSIQTRIVHDYLDHCWNESLINKKWIHVDSTLDNPFSFNNPYYYEQNWGKKYEYVLAFSANGIEDVTRGYTEQWQMVQKRRGKKDKTETFKRIYLSIIK